ncbi:MAG TPA: glycosyl hydrolase family 18 protein [Asticcacaulis sp.]
MIVRAARLAAALIAPILIAPAFIACGAQAAPKPAIIAYLPTFRGDMAAHLDAVDLSRLTQIDIAFVNPAPDGAVVRADALACEVRPQVGGATAATLAELRTVVSRAHAAGVKVFASLGGGVIPACAGDWATLLSPAMRPLVEANLLQFARDFDLDGLDIDLEWRVLSAVDAAGDYTPFARDLSRALHRDGKRLSCATASQPGGMIPAAAIPYFDTIGVMSYDGVGPDWGTPGEEHATLDMARRDLAVWRARGARKDRLVLGVPFYGHGFGAYKGGYDYKDILAAHGPEAAESDVVGRLCAGCDYITYNGRPTIRLKAELARTGAAGVMIWDITGDAAGADSLLGALYESLNADAK